MLNLRFIHLYVTYSTGYDRSYFPPYLWHEVDTVSFSHELRYLFWNHYPFKYLSSSFNPQNLVVLKLPYGKMKQLWKEDNQDLVNLRVVDLSFCVKLKKIPNLSSAINLQSLKCTGCESLVELPGLKHLTYLKRLEFKGCLKLKKFPELPDNFSDLDLSHTEIEEVPDSIQYHAGLRHLRLRNSMLENVSSNISKLESLRMLDLGGCKSLKTLSELPLYLWCLNADDCTSLEKVSFTARNVHSLQSLHDGDDAPRNKQVSMSFPNCKSLNQDSIKNIGAGVMLQIQSLAQIWVRMVSQVGYMKDYCRNQLFCCFPGNEISANEFEHRSVNAWLNLKITPNGCSWSRFLAFAICLVADLTQVEEYHRIRCEYQLTTANGEKFSSECIVFDRSYWRFEGDHVFIMFSEDMIIVNNDYVEASFEFSIKDHLGKEYKVEECGVHVFYVDAESYTISDVMNPTREF
ncbi:hypothetical protein V6N11_028355 [Hibiscus sabdariffa]|uniref:Uncharacterized protein n=1 Tax=Hibiscus sabdariffa TaxID=183260 RepID=A0ABR2NQB6_9ROSI